jgi:feruloyl-CoA synthase
MPIVSAPGMRPVKMGELAVDLDKSSDGAFRVRSKLPLAEYPRSLIDRLDHWAETAPDRVLFADRGPDGQWRKVTYAEAARHARAIGQYLLDKGLSAERPLAILSGNSLEHALLALGGMTAGVPYAAISQPYSLVSTDHSKLKHIFGLLTPGMVFAADGAPFAKALDSVMTDDMVLAIARAPEPGRDASG